MKASRMVWLHRAAGVGLLLAISLVALNPTRLVAKPPAAAVADQEQDDLQRREYTERHMGVPFKLIFYSADQEAANLAARAAFDRIAQLNSIMSDYDRESELMRLCRASGPENPVRVSKELFHVLAEAQKLSAATEGAFDVTVGPLTQLWRRSRRQGELPSPELLADARSRVGHQFVRLDPEAQTVTLLKEGMRLDLGGIAAGYAADEALRILREAGFPRSLVDSSGDIVAGEPPPGEAAWRIGVAPLKPEAPPSRFVPLVGSSISTSGDAFQHVEIDGVRYSHIVDPATGLGLTTRSSVTILAPTAIAADSLASAVSVLGPERGIALINNDPQTAALIVIQEGDAVKTYQSENWEGLAKAAAGEE